MVDTNDDETADEILLRSRTPSDLRRAEELFAGEGRARELAATKNALAAIGLATTPAAPADTIGARARLVASLRREGPYGAFADRIARLFDLPVAKAAEYMARLAEPGAWKPSFVPGMLAIPVRPGPKYEHAIAGFGKLVPGCRFPLHDHVGDETTLVLDGGFKNLDDGSEIWRGDELFRPAGTGHEFVVLDGVDCVAAVLAERGVTFR